MNVDLPPAEEKESEVDMSALSSLFHAGSNDQKVRDDVNKFEFLNKVNEHSRKAVKNIFKDSNSDFIGEVPQKSIKYKSPVKRYQVSTPPAGSEKGSENSRRSRQSQRTPILTPKRRSPSRSPSYKRSPTPKRRTPSPRRGSPNDRRRSPSPRRKTPSPRKRTPSPGSKRRSPSPKKEEDKNLLLQSYYLLQAQGIETKMKLDLTCDYDIIKSEVDRMRTELNSQKCIKFARKALVAIVSGLEFLNHKYDPCNLHLDGWSEHIMSTLGDYDGCFLRLYDKYKDSAGNVSPEIELLLLLGGSATMFHITKSFVSQRVPKFTEVAKESPELASKIAHIMAQKYDKEQEKEKRKDDSSDSDDDDIESVNTRNFENMSGGNRSYSIPTDMLSTPAFPALIQKMVHNPRPRFNTTTERKKLTTVEEETPPPLKENSENVLVVS
ncbi:MAG: hypothetical protein CMB64_04830 [Euryarchaeota archaeon]|nr:hypothetical protein [Euryarchaeota archaeon]|tara:strand:- start:1738 stop:3051 length:1314 start_codon:yes stop_codon:yes gene_type:complete